MIDRDMDSEKIEKLTKRELEVLKLLAVGMYNKGVADELHISERTVKIMYRVSLKRLMFLIVRRQRYLLFGII